MTATPGSPRPTTHLSQPAPTYYLQATCKRFHDHCQQQGLRLPTKGFRLAYSTNIPRQAGLSGSSAIICAGQQRRLSSSARASSSGGGSHCTADGGHSQHLRAGSMGFAFGQGAWGPEDGRGGLHHKQQAAASSLVKCVTVHVTSWCKTGSNP